MMKVKAKRVIQLVKMQDLENPPHLPWYLLRVMRKKKKVALWTKRMKQE